MTGAAGATGVSGVLAQQQPPPNAPEFGGSSPIALVVILLLFVATFFLVRSMNTHLRKVPPSFDDPGASTVTDTETDAETNTETNTEASTEINTANNSGTDRAAATPEAGGAADQEGSTKRESGTG